MSKLQPWVFLIGTLFQQGLDLILFPFRALLFRFRLRSFREKIAQILQAQSPTHSPTPRKKQNSGVAKRVFLSVGDISAEPHAIRLMREVNLQYPNVSWVGFGGNQMKKAGCEILFNPVELALIGFSGPIKQLPAHLGAFHRFLRLLRDEPPDLVILVDYPGFNLVLARAAKGRVPVFYYICPQIWAWAPWRLPRFRKWIDQALSIMPFEANYFRQNGIETHFVGHPIADHLRESNQKITRNQNPKMKTLALLPGSREREVHLNLPAMIRIAERLRKKFGPIECVVAHERDDIIPQLQKIAGAASFPIEIRPGKLYQTLQKSHLALVKSGTAVLEVAHYGVPMVVFYKFPEGLRGRITDWFRRNFFIAPFFTSLNLLAGREIVPEFAYSRKKVEITIFQKALALWEEGPERTACKKALKEVRNLFDLPGTAGRVAEHVVKELAQS